MSKVLVLRTVNKDFTSRNGFKWPKSGTVVCPDFRRRACCGHGLHGFLWATGDTSIASIRAKNPWLVVRVDEKDLVVFCNKVKFSKGSVVKVGTLVQCSKYIFERLPEHMKHEPIIGRNLHLKYRHDGCVGDFGTIRSRGLSLIRTGTHSSVQAGDGCTVLAENGSKIVAGKRAKINTGDNCVIKTAANSTVNAGFNNYVEAGPNSNVIVRGNSVVDAQEECFIKGDYNTYVRAKRDSIIVLSSELHIKVPPKNEDKFLKLKQIGTSDAYEPIWMTKQEMEFCRNISEWRRYLL